MTRDVARTADRGERVASQRREIDDAWAEGTPPDPPLQFRRPLTTVIADVELLPHSPIALGVKRVLDLVVSALALVVLLPAFLVVAILVKATSRGPAVFAQERVGKGGRVFRFYKFRTMVEDAEDQKLQLEHLNEMQGPVFKIAQDPRVTRVGGWLRRTSLDELPQFWNVLRGDMSLVGPRPPLVDEVERYTKRQAQRLSVTPGLTGLWQVSGRSSIASFDRWVELDLQYAQNWSLWLDLVILAKTPAVVLVGDGAC